MFVKGKEKNILFAQKQGLFTTKRKITFSIEGTKSAGTASVVIICNNIFFTNLILI